MTDECIFCKIIRKEVPSQPIHEDHDLIAFPDKNPVAPVHVLVVPKEHMVNLNEAGVKDVPVLGKMLRLAARIADGATPRLTHRFIFAPGTIGAINALARSAIVRPPRDTVSKRPPPPDAPPAHSSPHSAPWRASPPRSGPTT